MSPETPIPQPAQGKGSTLTLRLDFRWVSIALLVVILVLILLWRPWQPKYTANARTVSVTGSATVKSKPDEYVFSPTYQFKNADKDAALKELTARSDVVTAGLKKLGVPDSAIKTDSSGYNSGYYYDFNSIDKSYAYTLSIVVTLDGDKLVQKVQDYLVSTSPTGNVSPYATFSTAKQKQLESQARDAATKEARTKAEQSAKNLGFKIGAVKSVDDGAGLVGLPMLSTGSNIAKDMAANSTSLQVQPGENDLDYSVTVVYYVR